MIVRAAVARARAAVSRRLFEARVLRLQRRAAMPAAACRAATRLIALARFDEADAVLEVALVRWPHDPDLLERYALSAHQGGRYAIALDRWERLRAASPDRAMAWCGIAANRRVLGALDEAETTIRQALERFPDDLVVASEAARVFDRRGAHAEAADQWRRLLNLEPALPDYVQGCAFSLTQAGRFDEAEAVLARGEARFPGDRDLLGTRAHLEMERGDWNAALALWRRHRALYPDDQAGWLGQGRAIAAIHLARSEADEASAPVAKAEIEIVEDEAARNLLLGFESLGADCEFGLVQRRFGAEPLGLLRFNDVRLASLLAALDAGFAAMGEPDTTDLVVSDSGEIYVTDARWGLGMHTFMFASRHDVAALEPKLCRRVAYLRDKLHDDLRAGEKVFVFKSDAIDAEGLRALHRALCAYGPTRLLHVRRAGVPLADEPDEAQPGEVRQLAPGLYVGALSRMGNAGIDWDIAFDEWLAICRAVAAAH